MNELSRRRDPRPPDALAQLRRLGETLPAETAPLRPGEAEKFETEIREVIEAAKSGTVAADGVPTPALGRGAAAAIAAAVEQIAHEVRSKVKGLVELCAEVERDGEALIEKVTREGLALERRIEGYARSAQATRLAIRDAAAGDEETRP